MPEEYPEQELREFIYLNDESINSHLSSLGVGLETARVAANVEETETSSRFAAVVPLPFGSAAGASKGSKSIDSDETEREVDITVPYKFQELTRQIKDEYEVKMPEKEDVEVEYGDVVAVEGIVSPLSFFRFEIAQDANLTLTDSIIAAEKRMNTLQEVLKNHNMNEEIEEIEQSQEEEDLEEVPVEVREARSEVNKTFTQISKGLTGGRVPIRIDSQDGFEGNSYGAVLDRTQLRIPEKRAFFQPRRYMIFGRVEDKILESDEWDPIDTTRVIQSFASEDVGISGFMDMIRSVAEDNQIEMRDEHITVDGPATIIDPLAVYW